MKKIVTAFVVGSVAMTSCAKDDIIDGGAGQIAQTHKMTVNVDATQTKVTSAADGAGVKFLWESTDNLGGWTGDSTPVKFSPTEGFAGGASAQFEAFVDDEAAQLRLVYPYSSAAIEGGKYSIDIKSQQDDFAGLFENVAANTYLINSDAIDITASKAMADVEMQHITASMAFKFSFPSGISSEKLVSLKVSGLPVAATVDLTKAASSAELLSDNTTPASITIYANSAVVSSGTEYSLEASILPFILTKDSKLDFEATLESGMIFKGSSNAATEDTTFAAGLRHTISTVSLAMDGDCEVKSIDGGEGDEIYITFSQPIDAPAATTAIAIKRNDVPMTITSLAVDPAASNRLIAKIEGGVWSGDVATVSWGDSALTASGAPLAAVADEVVKPYVVNLMVNGDFEGDGSDIKSIATPSWAATTPQYCQIEMFDGDNALKLQIPDDFDTNNVAWFESSAINLSYDVQYAFDYSYYIATEPVTSTGKIVKLFIQQKDSPWTGFLAQDFDMSAISTEWTNYSGQFSYEKPADATADIYPSIVKLENLDVAEVVYIDDIRVYEFKKHDDVLNDTSSKLDGTTIESQGKGESL